MNKIMCNLGLLLFAQVTPSPCSSIPEADVTWAKIIFLQYVNIFRQFFNVLREGILANVSWKSHGPSITGIGRSREGLTMFSFRKNWMFFHSLFWGMKKQLTTLKLLHRKITKFNSLICILDQKYLAWPTKVVKDGIPLLLKLPRLPKLPRFTVPNSMIVKMRNPLWPQMTTILLRTFRKPSCNLETKVNNCIF